MLQENDDIIQSLLTACRQIEHTAKLELQVHLRDGISWLIQHDFERLVQILYQLDVHEDKLKKSLQSSPDIDAVNIISDMIVERQVEKWKTKQELNNLHSTDDTDADERW